jgi:hypothetical protein
MKAPAGLETMTKCCLPPASRWNVSHPAQQGNQAKSIALFSSAPAA